MTEDKEYYRPDKEQLEKIRPYPINLKCDAEGVHILQRIRDRIKPEDKEVYDSFYEIIETMENRIKELEKENKELAIQSKIYFDELQKPCDNCGCR